MCNYTIAKRCCLKPISFSPLSDFGDWGESVSLLCRLFSNFSVEFKGDNDDDNRGSGR